MDKHKGITEQNVYEWCSRAMLATTEERAITWLAEILNGEYPLEDARGDIMSFREFQEKHKEQPTKAKEAGL